jgi:hypothetical protein
MKTKLIICLALILSGAWFASAQTNNLPAVYVHFGAEGDRFISTRVHLGEPIFVGAGDYWDLKGHIELRGTNFFGDLLGGNGQQSQFYRGPMVLGKPCFAQGGLASGGAGPGFWFVISTNSDSRPIVQHIRMEFGFTNQPVNPVQVRMDSISIFSNSPPRTNNAGVDPVTGLPPGHMLMNPTTGLPLRPKHNRAP